MNAKDYNDYYRTTEAGKAARRAANKRYREKLRAGDYTAVRAKQRIIESASKAKAKASDPEGFAERSLAASKAYKKRHPVKVSSSSKASKAKRAILHKEKLAAQKAASAKRLRLADPEKVRSRERAYHARFKESDPVAYAAWLSAKMNTRRARKIGARGFHSAHDIVELHRIQGGHCAYCKVSFGRAKRHVDHIMPLALGGDNSRKNIQLLCSTCNLSKGSKHPVVFAKTLGLLL